MSRFILSVDVPCYCLLYIESMRLKSKRTYKEVKVTLMSIKSTTTLVWMERSTTGNISMHRVAFVASPDNKLLRRGQLKDIECLLIQVIQSVLEKSDSGNAAVLSFGWYSNTSLSGGNLDCVAHTVVSPNAFDCLCIQSQPSKEMCCSQQCHSHRAAGLGS